MFTYLGNYLKLIHLYLLVIYVYQLKVLIKKKFPSIAKFYFDSASILSIQTEYCLIRIIFADKLLNFFWNYGRRRDLPERT